MSMGDDCSNFREAGHQGSYCDSLFVLQLLAILLPPLHRLTSQKDMCPALFFLLGRAPL